MHNRYQILKKFAVGLKFLERRLCQRVHSAVCTRPAANRTRLAGHEKPFLGPDRYQLSRIRCLFRIRNILNDHVYDVAAFSSSS